MAVVAMGMREMRRRRSETRKRERTLSTIFTDDLNDNE